jgi:hypothetical protein
MEFENVFALIYRSTKRSIGNVTHKEVKASVCDFLRRCQAKAKLTGDVIIDDPLVNNNSLLVPANNMKD